MVMIGIELAPDCSYIGCSQGFPYGIILIIGIGIVFVIIMFMYLLKHRPPKGGHVVCSQ
jgi:hypothetical protein